MPRPAAAPPGNNKVIGVGTAGLIPAAPPSEPYGRISRIRLSSRWFTRVGGAWFAQGLWASEKSP